MINKQKNLVLIILILFLGGILRLYNITNIPPALHGDELGVGYNAYSLIKLGVDEYGYKFPFVFRNDFSPLIHYLTIPSIYIFDLNEFSTRFPTSIVGIISIVAVYFFTLMLYKNQKLALISAFLFAISSWHIRTSRIAVEMTWALFFQLFATSVFIYSLNNKNKSLLLILSFILFSLSILSYQTAKLTTPLLVLFLIFRFCKKNTMSKYILPYLIFIILPILIYFTQRPLLEMRFIGISVFTVWKSTLPSQIGISEILTLVRMIISNYFKHFHPSILFLDSSSLRYYQVKGIGLFYLWESFFIVTGFIYLIRNILKKESQLILLWLIISPLAAAFTTGIPNANIGRALMMIPTMELLAALGIVRVNRLISQSKLFKTIIVFRLSLCLIVTVSIGYFMNQYYIDMPTRFSDFWGVPVKNAVKKIVLNENQVDKIVFTTAYSPQSYMYVLFYGLKDPKWLQENRGDRAKIVGYLSYGKYEFRPVNWEKDKDITNALLVGTPEEIPLNQDKNISLITTNNEVRLKIYKTNN